VDRRTPVVKSFGSSEPDTGSRQSLPFAAAALLAAIEGTAYAVDEAGTILGFSRGPFLPESGGDPAEPWDCTKVVGQCLFDLVQGAEVRDSYRTLHRAVWSGRRLSVGFEYRCDAPAIERRMRMSLSLIADGGEPRAVLYQSIVLSETPRVALPLFDKDLIASLGRSTTARPLVTLCSYCQRVAWPMDARTAERAWIEPAAFYHRGGPPDAVVSHGLCEDCFERVVGSALRPTPRADPAGS
jgi:hypothetical protein